MTLMLLGLTTVFAATPGGSQRAIAKTGPVSQQRMQAVYEAISTPHKFGLVMAPADNHHKMDCPTVFREGDSWYMTYLVYDGKGGKDGRGYETWLAKSDDLLHWTTLGRVLPFADKGWDPHQRGGYPALIDPTWGGDYGIKAYKNRYWMTYIGGDTKGYEQGVLKIGLASTDQVVGQAHTWKTTSKPILTPTDKDKSWWENLTLYKSSVLWDSTQILGKPFVMFYNAGGVNPTTKVKGERVGIALSDNMKRWTRYPGNPILNHEGGITGDAVVQRMGDLWVMFYFSAFRPGVVHNAFNTFCCSYDLVNWTDWTGEPLIYPSEPYDNQFAHKSSVICHEGVVYHFYCAVNKDDQRGIALATSKSMGRSTLRFPQPDAPTSVRVDSLLTDGWHSWLESDSVASAIEALPKTGWQLVRIPHNWDTYHGARRLQHGNLHGTAWYKRSLKTPTGLTGKRCLLYFEGVGSYATVFVNGRQVGHHRGGRTTFTLDITDALLPSGSNELLVKAEHPAFITDLPWVCGGCSGESGFSEGSQPLGIHRPVHLILADEARVLPFGVHLWNEAGSIKADGASTQVRTTVHSDSKAPRQLELVSRLVDAFNVQRARAVDTFTLQPGQTRILPQVLELKTAPERWSTQKPYLYTLITLIKENGKVIDEVKTPYGFRTVKWPNPNGTGDGRFFLNEQPLFINGICEYEHQLGNSHAFTPEQIAARIAQCKAAGFNAFREAHQPHNLRYTQALDREGLLQWSQLSAHIWFDTPAFTEQFLASLEEWIIERRNSPSIVMWGLQNESSLPASFAAACTELIRKLDPTASTERLVTTCNGGEGTDWNVVQNWSGTYSGDPNLYGQELVKERLNGEYGAWRTLDLHTEGGFRKEKPYSEDRFCHLMAQKIGLAEQHKDSLCGHYLWLLNSHDNPGRVQNEEGYREIDRIGPFNYKGLLTPWGEPLDAWYLYRSQYAPKETAPMVYLVSHTWPDRWTTPGLKDSLLVYSNCDSVVVYNEAVNLDNLDDHADACLGSRYRPKGPDGLPLKGSAFQWDDILVRYNVLHALGYVDGRVVAQDLIVLNHLPKAPEATVVLDPVHRSMPAVDLAPAPEYTYLYRVNCGGPDYVDSHGQRWMADRPRSGAAGWGSVSWTDAFQSVNQVRQSSSPSVEGLDPLSGWHPLLASQRSTNDPIAGTTDPTLFQTFRYGREQLAFEFPVKPGRYRIEFYTTEPWYGTGGSLHAEGWRIFDVAVNGVTLMDDLDCWWEAGHDGALKRVAEVTVTDTLLRLHFPEIKAGQALVCALAIAAAPQQTHQEGQASAVGNNHTALEPAPPAPSLFTWSSVENGSANEPCHWLSTNQVVFVQSNQIITILPPVLHGAQWLAAAAATESLEALLTIRKPTDLYIALPSDKPLPTGFEAIEQSVVSDQGERFNLAKARFITGQRLDCRSWKVPLVLAVPTLAQQEEQPLRPSIRYEAETARWSGVVDTGLVHLEKACVAVRQKGAFSVSWTVEPGLAAVYTLRFRYRNTTDIVRNLRIQVVAADGRVMRDDTMTFPPAPDKWRVISTTTGEAINAGRYSIRLSGTDASGIWFDCLDFQ